MGERAFVYGTLMKGQQNHRCIAPWVKSVQKATVDGILYHLPYGYPAVVVGPGKVYGELITFTDFKAALAAMDVLEGYEGTGQDNFYERIRTVAKLEDGSSHGCFMYVFQGELKSWLDRHGTLIREGDWLEYHRAEWR